MTLDLCRTEFEKWLNKEPQKTLLECGFRVDVYSAWQAAWNTKSDIAIPISNNPADNSQNIEWTGAAE